MGALTSVKMTPDGEVYSAPGEIPLVYITGQFHVLVLEVLELPDTVCRFCDEIWNQATLGRFSQTLCRTVLSSRA